ncbi:MAG: formylmethanofuran dehydrogenase [Deltaproteobacteria bacterium]|nr:formylmethanofuran dehydrogenase [Deltaproteobacteria bacterium]
MQSFDELLAKATAIHGHICAGQVIGVRLAMLGLEKIAIKDPRGADRKKLYVLVEIDRCATDAIQTVTGCSLGKRSLKWLDHGIMAATFVNLDTGQAVRVLAREESRQSAKKYCPEIKEKYQQQLAAYRLMPEEELFIVQDVVVNIPDCDMPGRPLKRVQCQICHEWVQDARDLEKDGQILCRNCADGAYFKVI